jgi:hypothetical protein
MCAKSHLVETAAFKHLNGKVSKKRLSLQYLEGKKQKKLAGTWQTFGLENRTPCINIITVPLTSACSTCQREKV